MEGLLIYNGGTVCGNGFNYFSAHVICQMMDFIGSDGWRSGEFLPIQNGYQITLDDVDCTRGDWSSCSYRTDGHDCGHQDDVFLTCTTGKI